jgi:hypothetical protein
MKDKELKYKICKFIDTLPPFIKEELLYIVNIGLKSKRKTKVLEKTHEITGAIHNLYNTLKD